MLPLRRSPQWHRGFRDCMDGVQASHNPYLPNETGRVGMVWADDWADGHRVAHICKHPIASDVLAQQTAYAARRL